MALNAGDADCTSGLSKRIYDAITGDSRNGFIDPLPDAGRDNVRALCWAIARGVVDELTENGAITVTITTSDSGLQQVSGSDTDAPATNKTLDGSFT